MTGFWSIVVPESGKNYVKNPSFELDAVGYTNVATGAAVGTRTRVTDWQKRGIYSYRIEKTGGAAIDQFGIAYAIGAPDVNDFLTGEYAVMSMDLRVVSGAVRFQLGSSGVGPTVTLDIAAGSTGRYSLVHGPFSGVPAAVTLQAYVHNSLTGLFYCDGVQLENLDYSTSYMDGDQEGHYWMGVPHNSKSIRVAEKSNGGREYNLDDLGYYVSAHSGSGMPPINILTQLQAVLPGELLRGYTVQSRDLQIQLNPQPTSQLDLHSKRKDLIDILRPDRSQDIQPLLLKYSGANSSKKVQILVVYESGLNFNSPQSGFSEDTPLRLKALYPFWEEEGNRAYSLSGRKTHTAQVNILRREDGIWNKLGSDLSGATTTVKSIIELKGKIYVGGVFDSAGGVANTRHIAVWDPETSTWAAVGTGAGVGANGVENMAIDASGNLYVVGEFASMGGVANTQRLARWTGSAWQSITAGGVANATVYDVIVMPDGDVVVCGAFTSINGTALNRIARWNGSAWSGFGSGLAVGGDGFCLALNSSGTLYVGGSYQQGNGVTVNRISYWNGTTFVSMGGGFTANSVTDVFVDSRDIVWVTGSFQVATLGQACDRVAYWNGVYWVEPGDGLNGSGIRLAEDSNGNIYVTGGFTQAGSDAEAQYIAIWNGSIWSHLDIVPNGSIQAICLSKSGNLYIGHDGTGDVYTSENTSFTYEGTVEAFPIFLITPTTANSDILWIENETTGEFLCLAYAAILNETLTIDLTPGARKVSSELFGRKWSAILQSSNFANFSVKPGVNKFKVLVNGTTADIFILVPTKHWSIDGVAT